MVSMLTNSPFANGMNPPIDCFESLAQAEYTPEKFTINASFNHPAPQDGLCSSDLDAFLCLQRCTYIIFSIQKHKSAQALARHSFTVHSKHAYYKCSLNQSFSTMIFWCHCTIETTQFHRIFIYLKRFSTAYLQCCPYLIHDRIFQRKTRRINIALLAIFLPYACWLFESEFRYFCVFFDVSSYNSYFEWKSSNRQRRKSIELMDALFIVQ